MLKFLRETLADWVVKLLIPSGATASAVALFLFVDAHFFHPGWSHKYVAWFPLVLVILVLSLALQFFRFGLAVVGIAAILSSTIFAFVYRNPSLQNEDWQLVGWLSHMFVYCFFAGLVAGTAKLLVEWLRFHR